MSVHHNLQLLEKVALQKAKEHNCNYNIIIMNHVNGLYDAEAGSTYEMVTDSYFEKERPYAIKLTDTNALLKEKGAKG